MDFLNIILNIIYFLIALTVLVSLHELGHLTMAKLFNVYCDEYSIGFGPKLFQIEPKGVNKKGKPRETKFSIRALPLGGYVAMAGEGAEDLEEFKNVDKSRFLNNIAKWKRAIIMVAGVFVNALVGLILLIVAFSTIPMADKSTNTFSISDKITLNYLEEDGTKHTREYESILYKNGITSSTEIKEIILSYSGNVSKPNEVASTKTYTISKETAEGKFTTYEFFQDGFNSYLPVDASAKKTYKIITVEGKEVEQELSPYISSISEKNGNKEFTYGWELIGIGTPSRSLSFGEVMTESFATFGDYSIAIVKVIGQLFIGEGFSQMGGPVAIVQNQITFASSGFNYFLLFWGLISINLAVVNLLPFPGLDGWHLLVVAIEGITRKEIPQKFKAIMSTIGLVLLLGLAAAIFIKDVIALMI